ncbi:N-acetylglucosamine-binding protein GbpA [Pseudoalteromonas sp. NEC-BIFX-2020_002]|uniref:N-acetylglucosamine-binding protein GbpA n=1 Tax=Pseudoalteromonas neustonica TaxID=1840331 RepID=A0ABU9U5Z3_9GAMM|nr:N-acetylglucosamine-binding protein GbpA [Pseudoalteromonas sp. NEC-BIFX-2020_002]NNG44686.1 N-acetylglucosamine-binding protein GbpA [Pseudoalteromonas sp. NEC-BIFX-2020_002]
MNILHKTLLAISPLALAMLLPVSNTASAHGYISKPESRGYLCRLRENANCGNVVYEPQSLEGLDRFPESGPVDGHIASAGLRGFGQLDSQSINRWTKRHIKAGPNEFSWTLTAAHSSRDWRYFITKKSWNPNSPLTRDQFEAVPFCEYQSYNKQPPRQLTHLCNVPSDRSGYHIVLGVWDVADTPMSFYNVVDVMIDNGDTSNVSWQDVGDIGTGRDLKVGDKVKTRVFGDSKELPSLQTVLEITTTEQGLSENWTLALAQKINESQSWLQAGQLNEDKNIEPISGRNEIFAQSNSGISSVELAFEMAPLPKPNFTVSGLAHNYVIKDGAISFDFTINISTKAVISATLNKSYNSVQSKTYQVDAGQSQLTLDYPHAQAGHYNLVISYVAHNGTTDKKSFHLNIAEQSTGTPGEPVPPVTPPNTDADFIFPENLSSYKANTIVLQPKNGKVYQCKPWPYNGYCVQWSEGSNQYEPGVGLYWNMAWIELK